MWKIGESLEKLKQLRQDLICKVDENNENYYLKSLEASVLQLLSICQQAYSLHKEIYEFEQMGIDEILEEIDRKKELFLTGNHGKIMLLKNFLTIVLIINLKRKHLN